VPPCHPPCSRAPALGIAPDSRPYVFLVVKPPPQKQMLYAMVLSVLMFVYSLVRLSHETRGESCRHQRYHVYVSSRVQYVTCEICACGGGLLMVIINAPHLLCDGWLISTSVMFVLLSTFRSIQELSYRKGCVVLFTG